MNNDLTELTDKMRSLAKELEDISPVHSTIILLVAADFARISSVIMGRPEGDIDKAFDKMMREWMASMVESGVVDQIGQDVTLMKFEDILKNNR